MKRLTGLLLLLISSSVQAETPSSPPLYQVEIIVFETGALRGWTEEFWPWPESLKNALQDAETAENGPFPKEIGTSAEGEKSNAQNFRGTPSAELGSIPDIDDILTGHLPPGAPAWFKRIRSVPPGQGLLTDALKRLTPQKGYRVVLHRAWIQPALPDSRSADFRLEEITPQGDQLEGTVRFYKNRYAHMDVSLTLERVIPATIRADFAAHENLPVSMLPEQWPFHIQASRKMKSGEWHYLDHPLFGVLMVIQRIQP